MANFKEKMKNKVTIGNRKKFEANETLNLVFHKSNKDISTIQLSALFENPFQPRKAMDKEALNGLAVSIKENGLLQPIIISSRNNSSKEFYIVAGHRRVEACKLLNKNEIDAVIYNIDETELKIFSLIENMQRDNLSAIEEAMGINELVNSGVSQIDISKKLGKSKSIISKLISISKLDSKLINYCFQNDVKISPSILYELSKLENSLQYETFLHILKSSMTRDEVRSYISSLSKNKMKSKVSPAKLFDGFTVSRKNNLISLKLDISKLNDKREAILEVEKILNELKSFAGETF